MIRINRMHYPVTVLGHGTRAGIWVQGCTIGCRGCASRDTWDPTAGEETDPRAITEWLDSLRGPIDGITISGGEPFQQPAELTTLLAELNTWRHTREMDFLVFSGYPWPKLRTTYPEALSHCDAVVAGPYIEARNTGTTLRGSNNQEIVPLTPRGEARYGTPAPQNTPTMQVTLDGDAIRLIGIPSQGDLARISAGLADHGITMETVTWLA